MARLPIDTVRVRYYNMLGREPDLRVDTLLGEASNFPSDEHQVTLQLSPGVYFLYTVGIDLAGNQSNPSVIVRIIVVDNNEHDPRKGKGK